MTFSLCIDSFLLDYHSGEADYQYAKLVGTDLIYATSEDTIYLLECLIKRNFVCWVRVKLATSATSGIM